MRANSPLSVWLSHPAVGALMDDPPSRRPRATPTSADQWNRTSARGSPAASDKLSLAPPVLSWPCLGLSHTTGRTSGRSIVIVSSRSGSASAFTVHPSIPATTSSAGHRERALSCPLQPVRSHRERARPRRCRVEDENRAFPLHLSRPPCRGY
ncbi:hypothetical protein ACCO45_009788 [Purpureocillium lilacinum]|uniref:Uncharacterized protein n=1 Tax=Purpureocillium lilacinum TaxID=33203 RepID=A0ACC4DM61_PURLI